MSTGSRIKDLRHSSTSRCAEERETKRLKLEEDSVSKFSPVPSTSAVKTSPNQAFFKRLGKQPVSGTTVNWDNIDLSVNIFDFDPTIFPADALVKVVRPGPNDISYSLLCRAFGQMDGTRSRRIIIQVLTNAFRTILFFCPIALIPTTWLCSNMLAASHKGVDLGVGPGIIIKALADVSGTTPARLRTLYAEKGDWGDVAQDLTVSIRTLVKPKPLGIKELHQALLEIAALEGTGMQNQKIQHVRRLLLASQSPLETKYTMRILIQNLRVGATRTSTLTALANAVVLHEELARVSKDMSGRHNFKLHELTLVKNSMAEAEQIIRSAFARIPDFDIIVAHLIDGGVKRLEDSADMIIGIPIRPMLGVITRDLAEVIAKMDGRSYACEYKYDGQRLQLHYQRNGTEQTFLFSRNLETMTAKYPDIAHLIPSICKEHVMSFILDSEVVAIGEDGKTLQSFQHLANRTRKDVKVFESSIIIEKESRWQKFWFLSAFLCLISCYSMEIPCFERPFASEGIFLAAPSTLYLGNLCSLTTFRRMTRYSWSSSFRILSTKVTVRE